MSIDERIEMTQELIRRNWELQVASGEPGIKDDCHTVYFYYKKIIDELRAEKSVHVS